MFESTLAVTNQYLSINFGIENWKLNFFNKYNFRLNISDFYNNYNAMNLKYKNLFMVFFIDFYNAYLLKSLFKGHVLN
jgi:hypothetical protein